MHVGPSACPDRRHVRRTSRVSASRRTIATGFSASGASRLSSGHGHFGYDVRELRWPRARSSATWAARTSRRSVSPSGLPHATLGGQGLTWIPKIRIKDSRYTRRFADVDELVSVLDLDICDDVKNPPHVPEAPAADADRRHRRASPSRCLLTRRDRERPWRRGA